MQIGAATISMQTKIKWEMRRSRRRFMLSECRDGGKIVVRRQYGEAIRANRGPREST
jgi:hypothetical protein